MEEVVVSGCSRRGDGLLGEGWLKSWTLTDGGAGNTMIRYAMMGGEEGEKRRRRGKEDGTEMDVMNAPFTHRKKRKQRQTGEI